MQTDLIVLYGTQTNTAKYAAEEVGREAIKRNLKPTIMEFDEFPITRLPVSKLIVFIIATTGDGEPPTTM
jgi:sulfite reductase alpha subunit-like flavoprotein